MSHYSVISLWNLGKLNYLQDFRLTISSALPSGHLERNMEALGSLIGGHGNLKTIVVAHCSSIENTVVRGAFKVVISWDHMVPPPFLQRFEFSPHSCCILKKIPKWVTELENLCILRIAVRQLQINWVDTLRELPALTALSLYVRWAPIEEIVFEKASGFSVLKYFKWRCTIGIPSIKFEADSMPNLWKLKLGFSAIPRIDQHQLIHIEHMPELKEISVKISGAASHIECAVRCVFINHPSNPTIKMQLVGYSSYGDKSTRHEQQSEEIYEGKTDEYGKRLVRPADKRYYTHVR
jgi:hypothetical protein